MTALSANLARPSEQGDRNEYGVLTATTIYEGSAVGIEASTGYARALVAGDLFVGFAEAKVVNAGASGALTVRVIDEGKVQLAVGSLAITDIGKPVYASDDATFTLTATSNSYVGHVVRFVESGIGIVKFEKYAGIVAGLTDNSGGTPGGTIAAITQGAYTGSADLVPTQNAIASLAAKVNTILQILK